MLSILPIPGVRHIPKRPKMKTVTSLSFAPFVGTGAELLIKDGQLVADRSPEFNFYLPDMEE